MEQYIIREGLKINDIPPYYKEDNRAGRPRSVEGPQSLTTVISSVWKLEEALGIKVKGRYLHGKRLAGIKTCREK